jgi:hypothetical protein
VSDQPWEPLGRNWAQAGVPVTADREHVEAKLAMLRALLPAGDAFLRAEVEEDLGGGDWLTLTMAVP